MTDRTDASSIDLTPMLAPERRALLEFLRSLEPGDWELPTECPEWNVKGLALHILGDDLSLLARQRDAATNGLLLFAQDHPGLGFRALLDGFNEQWVGAASYFSTRQLLDLLALAGTWSEEFYTAVDGQEISGEPVGFFRSDALSPYWQVIAREYVERFVHQSQLRRAVGAPELSGEMVTSAARVIIYAIASWLRDYEAADASTIAVDFGPCGAWTWKREPDHWVVLDGARPAPTASLTIASPMVVAVLSRGASVEEVAAATTTDGDQSLATGAMAVFAPLVARPAPDS